MDEFDDSLGEMPSNDMVVAVRVRPLSSKERNQGHKSCIEIVGDSIINIQRFGQPDQHLKSQKASTSEYAFDYVFGDTANQDEVYEKTVKPLIPTILDGFNATIFAYGATGAGKTHTMMGSEREGKNHSQDLVNVDGIIPHSLVEVFDSIERKRKQDREKYETSGHLSVWNVVISYLEVYNEQIRDLLQPSDKSLSLREDPARGIVHVAGLHVIEVSSAIEVMELLRRGNCNRKTEATGANQVSSRSHAVLQLNVKHSITSIIGTKASKESTVEGKLCLIDLAGSERASTTQNKGMRLTEGANINKSLLALANCINALATSSKPISRRQSDIGALQHYQSGGLKVPSTPSFNKHRRVRAQYRDSKLTHLLKSSLEGDCRLVMIANINPSHVCFEESQNTLKYANRAKNIKVRPRVNVMTADLTHQQRADKLEKENILLRQQLAEVKMWSSSNHIKRSYVNSQDKTSCEDMNAMSNKLNEENVHAKDTIQRLQSLVELLKGKINSLENELKKANHTNSSSNQENIKPAIGTNQRVTKHQGLLVPTGSSSKLNKENILNLLESPQNSGKRKHTRRQSLIPRPTSKKQKQIDNENVSDRLILSEITNRM